jgi:hypothetical protein
MIDLSEAPLQHLEWAFHRHAWAARPLAETGIGICHMAPLNMWLLSKKGKANSLYLVVEGCNAELHFRWDARRQCVDFQSTYWRKSKYAEVYNADEMREELGKFIRMAVKLAA